MRSFLTSLFGSWAVACLLAAPAQEAGGPLTPAEAVKSFRLADPDLVIELVAAEPEVASPVAIAWDEDGRLYVAEMVDYPLGPTRGRIRRLEGPDTQGRYGKASVFADKLPFPNGVLPWKGGILVTAAPNIWYLKDSGGTGPAELRQVILTGFAEGNQQLRVNGLYWGLDNWIYGANGRSGGRLRRPADSPEKAVAIDRHDFRFQPETGRIEAVSGFSQFGLAHDDWGNRFPSWNTAPFRHVVLEERYLARNPFLAVTASVAEMADPADPARVYPLSPPPTTFNREPLNFFNASCGNTIYRGDLLGEKYRGNLFVCESLTNLVQRRVLEPGGLSFLARRGEAGKEFLAATDPWFHPVNLAGGPDGALYLVDFYRRWVEHPHFVPEALRQQQDWRQGSNHGRIWRIRPRGWKAGPRPGLGRASMAQLVQTLNHANGWWRDTAQRLLVERQDRQAIPWLKKLANQARLPQARLQALWTLQGLKALEETTLVGALDDPHEVVRRHALQLCENRWGDSSKLRKAVQALGKDRSPAVLFQAALLLGEANSSGGLKALGQMAARGIGDEWVRLAILSSVGIRGWDFLQVLVKEHPEWLARPGADQTDFLARVGSLVGTRAGAEEIQGFLELLTRMPAEEPLHGRLALLSGLAEGLGRSGQGLSTLVRRPGAGLEKAVGQLEVLWQFAHKTALADQELPSRRVQAVRLLSQAQPPRAGKVMLELLDPRQPQEVQLAAIRGLAELGDKRLIGQVLDRWDHYTIGLRRELLASMLRWPNLVEVLLQALEKEKLGPAELDPSLREALLRLPDARLRARAAKTLQGGFTSNRPEIVRKYQAALQLAGDSDRGAKLFARHCLSCHQLQGKGHRVGADLAGLIGRRKEILLVDILDPSKEVAPDFIDFLLVTRRGQVLTGMIAAETPSGVKLRRAEGTEEVILRSEIQELRSTGKSLMPEGLEQVLSLQDMADLLQFLQRPAALPK